MKKIYGMRLHSITTTTTHDGECNLRIIRVPGGWLYLTSAGQTFVPYHDEFRKNETS